MDFVLGTFFVFDGGFVEGFGDGLDLVLGFDPPLEFDPAPGFDPPEDGSS